MKKKMKIIYLSILTLIILSGLVTATWLLQIEDQQTTFIVSEENGTINFQTNFEDFTLNTTLGADSNETTALINNSGTVLQMQLLIEEQRIDVADGCTDYINDVTAEYRIASIEVFNGTVLNISNGPSNFKLTVFAEAQSCPQTFNTNVTLTEV